MSTQFQSYYGTKEQFNSLMENAKAQNYHISGLQISNVNITGDNATVNVSYTSSYTSGGETSSHSTSCTFYLIKEGDLWKIYDIGGAASAVGYPAIAAAATYDNTTGNIRITVSSGSIPAYEWGWAISSTIGATPTWVTGTEALDAPYVVLENRVDSYGYATDDSTTYYVSLRHTTSGHIYFADTAV